MEPTQQKQVKEITDEEIIAAARLFPREEFQARLSQELGIPDLVLNFEEKIPYANYPIGLIWESASLPESEFGILKYAIKELTVGGFSGFTFYPLQSQKNKIACSSQIYFSYEHVVGGGSNGISIGEVTGIFEGGKWNLTYKIKLNK